MLLVVAFYVLLVVLPLALLAIIAVQELRRFFRRF